MTKKPFNWTHMEEAALYIYFYINKHALSLPRTANGTQRYMLVKYNAIMKHISYDLRYMFVNIRYNSAIVQVKPHPLSWLE